MKADLSEAFVERMISLEDRLEVLERTASMESSSFTPFIPLPLINGWVHFGGVWQTPQYRRVGDMVSIRGSIKSGTIGLACATLPVGYRPLLAQGRATLSNGAFGVLTIDSAGAIVPFNGSNAQFTIDTSFSVLS
jgi:hypothetical protein